MDFNPINMQMSIPRAHDTGEVQQAQQHKPEQDQTLLAQEAMKQQEAEREKSTKMEKSDNGLIHDGRSRGGKEQRQNKKKRRDPDPSDQRKSKHPYKGKHIDYSL